ncbi:hypothetical protein AAG570_007129, partial [Ranatra chinensis]
DEDDDQNSLDSVKAGSVGGTCVSGGPSTAGTTASAASAGAGGDLTELEFSLLGLLCQLSLLLPVSAAELCSELGKRSLVHRQSGARYHPSLDSVVNLLQKFSTQQLISLRENTKDGLLASVDVISVEHAKLQAMINELETAAATAKDEDSVDGSSDGVDQPQQKSVKSGTTESEEKKREKKTTDIMSLLSMPSIREKETKKVGVEILELLSKPTAKERSLAERFRSNGAQVMEFCPHGTRADCSRESGNGRSCSKLHFKKIIQKHTDDSLGDCSFLNTCFHMDTCKYVHYEVDGSTLAPNKQAEAAGIKSSLGEKTILYPPQWIQCDLRYLDMTVLGKFAVVMADPPWDIHMELPYGTMSDDEMRQLGVPALQDDGVIFLWVTGRAMELGRECLQLWGYERVDEIIWVKTNQLQRIIRTGRTGHWLNHGKEHCLVGKKGSVDQLNRGLDCDVIVAEVRATSHKPDEIYGIIERLSPGTRKIELFGRPHNVQPNWITLGNQVDGVRLVDPELIQAFRKRYPDGNCMAPPKT